MIINIIKGDEVYLEDCYEALIYSEIGEAYFKSFDAKKILLGGLKNKEIDVAIDTDGKCLGFIWYERYGAFGIHTYLHIIAIKQQLRGKGIGKKLIEQFE
ncbi:GNAT family N-acetyltransferase [Clostridium yunnanense]|uniref:GNAT family N-acetyltransferase n=1 Tax=Clostridium yunnanense TaxID=2800325 RepID=UPI001FADE7BF|nr:GNAT family N-acetyltransferase [Clostridium yunnanense]